MAPQTADTDPPSEKSEDTERVKNSPELDPLSAVRAAAEKITGQDS